MSLSLSDIKIIQKNPSGPGYVIVFNDNRQIVLHKRRTIPALLTLIKYGEGCEHDLTATTSNLAKIKEELKGKIHDSLIQKSYSDANKPFSELWNEEGFVFIRNPPGAKRGGSQKYVLDLIDHDKLFTVSKKADRKPPSMKEQEALLQRQNAKCNLCGSSVMKRSEIAKHVFAKDRATLSWDHRVPVGKNGPSESGNYQGLCFYCNKSKWQICNVCTSDHTACANCVLAFPEKTTIIHPTSEDIADRLRHPVGSPL